MKMNIIIFLFFLIFYSIICQKKHSELLKVYSVCLNFFFISHKDNIIFLSYDTKNFWIAQKFPDSNATLLPGFFSLCKRTSNTIGTMGGGGR